MHHERDFSGFLAALLSPPLMLMGVVIGYLRYQGYPLNSAEAFAAVAIVAGAGMVFGLLVAVAGPTNFRALLGALLVLFFVDLQFGIVARGQIILGGKYGFPMWAILATYFVGMFAILMVVLPMRRIIAAVLVTSFGVFFLTSLLLPVRAIQFGPITPDTPAVASGGAPPMIHVVLDGHIGIEGIPLSIPGGSDIKRELMDFYQKWGFRLYGRAYSPYAMTFNSVGNTLNAEESAEDLSHFEASPLPGRTYAISKNRYFRQARQNGRTIRVYQTDYIDYCTDEKAPVDYCYTYPAFGVSNLIGTDLRAVTKARLILSSYFRQSGVLVVIARAYAKLRVTLERLGLSFGSQSTGITVRLAGFAVPEVMSTLRADVSDNPQGTLFFAHLLLPHEPYVWDSSCQLRTDAAQWKNRRLHDNFDAIGTKEYRDGAYADYFDQIRCVTRKLDELFTSMEEANVLQDATVVVHGDHGSRITLRDPVVKHVDDMSISDYVASFSTLFAIRMPGLEPRYEDQQQPLPNLMAEHIFAQPPPMSDRTLYLRRDAPLKGTELLPLTMPDF